MPPPRWGNPAPVQTPAENGSSRRLPERVCTQIPITPSRRVYWLQFGISAIEPDHPSQPIPGRSGLNPPRCMRPKHMRRVTLTESAIWICVDQVFWRSLNRLWISSEQNSNAAGSPNTPRPSGCRPWAETGFWGFQRADSGTRKTTVRLLAADRDSAGGWTTQWSQSVAILVIIASETISVRQFSGTE